MQKLTHYSISAVTKPKQSTAVEKNTVYVPVSNVGSFLWLLRPNCFSKSGLCCDRNWAIISDAPSEPSPNPDVVTLGCARGVPLGFQALPAQVNL